MNRRLAKKMVKKKHHLRKYPGNLEPRMIDKLLSDFKNELGKALDEAFLFGNKAEKARQNSLPGIAFPFYISMPRRNGKTLLQKLLLESFNNYILTGRM